MTAPNNAISSHIPTRYARYTGRTRSTHSIPAESLNQRQRATLSRQRVLADLTVPMRKILAQPWRTTRM